MKRRRTPEDLRRRGVRLEWATNAWNAMEVVVTVSLGVRAGSLALIAFGLDSVIEIFASTLVIQNLRDDRSDPGDRRVHRALRLIAFAFWVLAAFLVLISIARPDSRRSARQFTLRHRVPGDHCVHHVRTGAAQAHHREGPDE